MLADSKKNQFDKVLIYSLDRFGRNLFQSLKNEFELQSYGVTVPLGYRLEKIDPLNEKSKKRFVVDEENAKIVREIFSE